MILDEDDYIIRRNNRFTFQDQEFTKAAKYLQRLYLNYIVYYINKTWDSYIHSTIQFRFFPKEIDKPFFVPFGQSVRGRYDNEIAVNINLKSVDFYPGEKFDANDVDKLKQFFWSKIQYPNDPYVYLKFRYDRAEQEYKHELEDTK